MIKPLTGSTWADFVSLMESDSQCADCWCLNHREPTGCPTGTIAKEKMNTLVMSGKVHGLLAYQGDACVGWIAIDPMANLSGHDLQSTGKDQEWAIHCLFVKDGCRGLGISNQLVQAAIKHAQSHGARIISAFPIPPENRKRFPPNEAEFSGRFSTYQKLGFKHAGAGFQRVHFHRSAGPMVQ